MTKLGFLDKPNPTFNYSPIYKIQGIHYVSSKSSRNARACIELFAYTSILLSILLLLYCRWRDSPNTALECEHSKKWNYLIFCQLWPPASCINPETQNCTIPQNVTYWTVHGLWPSKTNSSFDPQFCNKTWKFDVNEIQPIRKEMDLNWPDCHDDDPVIGFWKHEWEKHGTCAVSVTELDTQLKYFSKALKMHATYDLATMMADAGYVPKEDEKIVTEELLSDMQSYVGKNVSLQCIFHKKAIAPILASVYICFDKNLTLINCDSSDTNCNEDSILYWPFPNTTTG